MIHDDIKSILISEEEIEKSVTRIADEINRDYADKEILLVVILKGSLVFAADLMRKIHVPLRVDFMQASSYGSGTESSGLIKIKKDLENRADGRHILIIEDIIDSGNTLAALKNELLARNPASVKICTLLNKPERRVTHVDVDYSGMEIPDEFVVGYGLDFDERYRHLPYIGILSPRVYAKM